MSITNDRAVQLAMSKYRYVPGAQKPDVGRLYWGSDLQLRVALYRTPEGGPGPKPKVLLAVYQITPTGFKKIRTVVARGALGSEITDGNPEILRHIEAAAAADAQLARTPTQSKVQ